MHVVTAVIAVLTGGVAVGVCVGISGRTVAIVICWVGAVVLRCAGKNIGAGVIAVIAKRDVARRRGTGARRRCGVAVAIAVHVGVEGARVQRVLIDLLVAVIVKPVADFGIARENGGVCVVAVEGARGSVLVRIDGGIPLSTAEERDGEEGEQVAHEQLREG